MPVVTRLIVVQSDTRVAEALRYAFERRGARVDVWPADQDPGELGRVLARYRESTAGKAPDGPDSGPEPEVIVAGTRTESSAPALLTTLSKAVEGAGMAIPILCLGNGIPRDEALAAGASEVFHEPAYLRDVVTMAQLMTARQRAGREVFRGDIRDYGGAFYLIRAVSATRRSAFLTMVRGLRRSEVRFFQGEVTSAQVSLVHGLSAFHHVLLWRAGNFELRFEDVVRRQQIPVSPDELMSDAQRFLAEVNDIAHVTDLAAVYEHLPGKTRHREIPAPIQDVLDLMDGTRAVPDVVEDSPYRLFDTLRIVERLVALEWVQRVQVSSQGFSIQLMRGLGGWQSDGRMKTNPIMELPGLQDEPEPDEDMAGKAQPESPIDWSDVLPTSPHADENLAQVVPAAMTAGEIVVGRTDGSPSSAMEKATQEPDTSEKNVTEAPGRERLEAITSPEQRDRLFALDQSVPGDPEGASPSSSPWSSIDGAEHSATVSPDERTVHEQSADAPDSDQPKASEPMTEDGARTDDRETSTAVPGPAGAGPDKEAGDREHGFTEDEEAFFREGARLADRPHPPAESFDDLDEGYEPQSFWQRLFGRKKPRAARPGGPASRAKSPAARPEAKIDARPEAKIDARPEAKINPRPETKIDARPAPAPGDSARQGRPSTHPGATRPGSEHPRARGHQAGRARVRSESLSPQASRPGRKGSGGKGQKRGKRR